MKRFHVHLNVSDLDSSVRFYSQLFAAAPSVLKADYAKWMLEDPRVNFAISDTGRAVGVDHLGIQVDSNADLLQLGRRLDAAGGDVMPEDAATCCYARSDKLWTEDPQGTRWETFHTLGDATTYHGAAAACGESAAACTPEMPAPTPVVGVAASCCAPRSACC